MHTEERLLSELIEQHHQLKKDYLALNVACQRQLDDAYALRRHNAQLSDALAAQSQLQTELLMSAKNAALAALVAGMSHELSTPVGNSLVAASTLQDELEQFHARLAQGVRCSDVEQLMGTLHTGTDIVLRNLHRVSTLVDGFRNVTVDRRTLVPDWFALHSVVEAITAARQVPRSGHRLCIDVPRSLLCRSYRPVLGDVLAELLGNALRHGLAGRSGGLIQLAACAKGGDLIELTVQDDGCGIAAEHVPCVFDPFFTTTLGQGRNGLGLYAVYNLVTATLRGRIHVSSGAGGTCFTVILPRTIGDAEAA